MKYPPFLKHGDKIGIVAPGRKVKLSDVEESIAIFEAWGLQVMLAKNLFSNDHSYLAGTDSQRLMDFQTMLNDDSVKAIICARGGYGSTRILDQLDFTSFLKRPKWIAGFSDITAFHLELSKRNIASIHSTMPILFSKKESADSIQSLHKILFGQPESFFVDHYKLNRLGKANGELIGGNLSLLVDSIGTRSELYTEGKILVLEEIDEYLYKVDRMMVHLKRSGKFDKLSGLVVGHMTDIKDTELTFGENLQDIILNHTSSFQFPIAFNFPMGHENPNQAWIHGAFSQLYVTKENATLTFL